MSGVEDDAASSMVSVPADSAHEPGPSTGRRTKKKPTKRKVSESPSPARRKKRPASKKKNSAATVEEDGSLDSSTAELNSSEIEMKPAGVKLATADDLYFIDMDFYDLGYVARTLGGHGVPEDVWRSRCYTFTFRIEPSNFAGVTDVQVRRARMKALRSLSHFRLIWMADPSIPNADGSPEVAPAAAILPPPSVCSATGLPLVLLGRIRFPDVPAENRPGGWVDWRGGLIKTPLPVDALRHFALGTIGSDRLEEIPVPAPPKAQRRPTGNYFQLRGVTFRSGAIRIPHLLPILPDKPLHFVLRNGASAEVEVEEEETMHIEELNIDVYITKRFFEMSADKDLVGVPDAADVKNGRRLRFLIDSFRPIVVKENAFLESLVLQKFEPSRTAQITGLFGDTVNPKDLKALFDHVKAVHADQRISTENDPQHRWLKLQMHDYQRRAVTWMVEREQSILLNLTFPNPLFFPVELEHGKTVWTHYTTGQLAEVAPRLYFPRGGILADEMGLGKTLETISLMLTNRKPKSEPHLPADMENFPKGGGAARDLPLTCHCSRPPAGCASHPMRKMFLCGLCQRQHRIECKTTLVVAPAAIIKQWMSEIGKSCRPGRVLVHEYRGISGEGLVSPWKVAEYDIVLASYEMLSKELLWVNAETRKTTHFRVANTHRIIPSPLLQLKFWRFILDEAQMVDSHTANYSLMAMKIHAHFYWAVTGTPIEQGVPDLHALFQFIEMTPWNHARWFNEYLTGPFRAGILDPLRDAMGECMWRLEKADVEREMDLPACTTVMHAVQFNGIEKQLYQQVYRDCIKGITEKLRRDPKLREKGSHVFGTPFTALKNAALVRVIKDWMGFLAKLCTSPTRVSYFFKVTKKVKNAPAKEDDGLDALGRVSRVLAERAKQEFTNAFRTCIMERNALAAYFWLNNEHDNAAQEYRTAKRMCTETDEDIEVDTLQKLHILTNLGQLLAEHGDSVTGKTMEDDTLLQQAEALRNSFISRKRTIFENCVAEIAALWKDGIPTKKSMTLSLVPVYESLKFVDPKKCGAFLDDLKVGCMTAPCSMLGSMSLRTVRSRPLPSNYESIEGLKRVLQARWDEIITERQALFEEMDGLRKAGETGGEEFADQCANCHIRASMNFKNKCLLCKVEKTFDGFEDLIFRTQIHAEDDDEDDAEKSYATRGGVPSRMKRRKFDAEEEDLRRSDQHDSDFEITTKGLISFVRRELNKEKKLLEKLGRPHPDSEEFEEKIENEIKRFQKLLDDIKKEYLLWRELWCTIYEYTSAWDEVKQSVFRVRFMTEDELAVKAGLRKADKVGLEVFRWLLPPTDDMRPKINQAQAHLTAAMQNMTRTHTHFKYTRNMYKAYNENHLVQEKECIVCYDPVGEKWAMFPCAHVICEDCLALLLQQNAQNLHAQKPDKVAPCPVCRKSARVKEILTQKQVMNENELKTVKVQHFNTMQLKGAPSKMECVVRTIFTLIQDDPQAKIIIFSEYTDVLEDYGNILTRNAVATHRVKSKAHIPVAINKLRDGSARILLMPIYMGGKGLTITEANHIFFLEPLTNKGAELQAIGRIHRMGQQKPTFVHKFIVTDTVEERIHDMMSTIGEEGSLSQRDLTLAQIMDLLKSTGSHHGPDMDNLNSWINLARQESGLEPPPPVVNDGASTSGTANTAHHGSLAMNFDDEDDG
ncbi:E3 ubiquitin-protein ligase SHPRH [Hypsibius exemplaris]|uniref:E3 ubiquitin-protein ligase SHPRH n=1 Tax=Hypsibius exemplaris TaxID=2072580 RepID=A0A1W0WIY6_HYPEX|nr:E3 ubiquitin-protein ligase SHPRH [Hypsibius exemplaris]